MRLTIILSFLLLSFGAICQSEDADLYYTKTGYAHFFSSAPLEDIEAENNDLISFFNKKTGKVIYEVTIKRFEFEKSLMQEHFNEKYLESDKYPKSTFKGFVKDIDAIDFDTPGTYDATADGTLDIHGVEQERTIEGTITVNDDGSISVEAKFPVILEDHKVKIPKMVVKNIAEVVDVTVKFDYEVYTKE